MEIDSILNELKEEIAGIKSGPSISNVGEVMRVGDGVASIRGLSEVRYSEMLEFETEDGKILGLALNLEESSVGAIVLGASEKIKEGQTVKATGTILSIPVGDNLIGRVINPLGEPIDGGPALDRNKMQNYLLERIAPGVITRQSVNSPLQTGIKAIDATIPIGRGQRELIIGDRQTGKTAIAIDTIINQGQNSGDSVPICIYVAIGQKESKVAQIVEKLKQSGAMKYSIVVSAGASAPASLQYLAPYAGCAIGEYFMEKGQDALVVYDDLSKHAWAYRQISLLLRRPPGREAYPGDIFYLHSRLLERAAKLNKDYGGGSLTALPIIETQLGDISAYVPTNVISITDGQIYLEPELFYQGIRPAVNVGLSVSRVGSAAQTKAMKKVAGTLRLELAQFRELAAFAQFGQDLDSATKLKIDRGRRLTEILKQPQYLNMPFEKQVISIFVATNGFLDTVNIEDVSRFENGLLKFLDTNYSELLKELKDKKDLSEDLQSKLKKAAEDFKNNYFNGNQ
ncbi:MAG TPA: F0F1 ATP synthase subunit alpha [Candidatus Paceibacterota bacterium]|nr:F0F1 ATP synthase subunit alpha [Candidatus Paceibacterota bacterium]